ncbi:unnamed protein product [Psylliodes chrysocephalus]|uniref:Uncharacterized protein n=1 Tax=Psylliodes chrysocephalus TaxID=3402493 RepID=A0A9P0D6Q6_9CUCU|nr:unnamed protein product [Psylliodes chrysocephala]
MITQIKKLLKRTHIDTVSVFVCISPEIKNKAEEISSDLIPAKSKKRYEEIYAKFLDCRDKKVEPFSETVHTMENCIKLKPTTLWSSMLRTVFIKIYVDISKYSNLVFF